MLGVRVIYLPLVDFHRLILSKAVHTLTIVETSSSGVFVKLPQPDYDVILADGATPTVPMAFPDLQAAARFVTKTFSVRRAFFELQS